MMNKIILCVSATLSVGMILGDSATTNLTREARRELMMKRQGGILVKPGSQRGKAIIFNAQTAIDRTNIVAVARKMSRDLRLRFDVIDGTLDGLKGDWSSILKKENAAAAVIVGDDTGTPSLLVAPDEFWAVVNVSRLGDGLKTDSAKKKFVPNRIKRQIFRGFALIGGSGRPENESPATVRTLNELDSARDALPVDALAPLAHTLEGRGMTKEFVATYRLACQQGWAPTPTNDAQKAIWDKIHAMPTEPIKIKPETKKVME